LKDEHVVITITVNPVKTQ